MSFFNYMYNRKRNNNIDTKSLLKLEKLIKKETFEMLKEQKKSLIYILEQGGSIDGINDINKEIDNIDKQMERITDEIIKIQNREEEIGHLEHLENQKKAIQKALEAYEISNESINIVIERIDNSEEELNG